MRKKWWFTLTSLLVTCAVLFGCNAVDDEGPGTDEPDVEQDTGNPADDMEMDEEMDQMLPDGDDEDNLRENGVNGDNGMNEDGEIIGDETDNDAGNGNE